MSDLPPGWEWATVGDVADVLRGVTYRKEEARTQPHSGYAPLLRATNIADELDVVGGLVYVPVGRVQPGQYLKAGDIVVASSSGSVRVVGKSAQLRTAWSGTWGAFCSVIRPGQGLDVRYLSNYFRSPFVRDRWSALAAGTNIHNLRVAHIVETPVPIPPIGEQRRIVAALEDHLSRLDAGSWSIRTASARLAILWKSILAEKLDVAELGVPKWDVYRLGEVAQLASGQTPRGLIDLPIDDSEEAVPFYKVGDMNIGDGRHMSASRLSFSRRDLMGVGVRVRPAGTVLMPKRGGAIATNKKRILTTEAAYDLNTMGLVPGELVDPHYLWYWLQGVDLAKLADGSNVPQINKTDLEPLLIPVPPRHQQTALIAELDDLRGRIGRMQLDAAAGLGLSLRRSLLHEAFSGRLVPQDADDEPASVLLHHIRAVARPNGRRVRAGNTIQETLL
jgi:type I restriction enzyme S subunit